MQSDVLFHHTTPAAYRPANRVPADAQILRYALVGLPVVQASHHNFSCLRAHYILVYGACQVALCSAHVDTSISA